MNAMEYFKIEYLSSTSSVTTNKNLTAVIFKCEQNIGKKVYNKSYSKDKTNTCTGSNDKI